MYGRRRFRLNLRVQPQASACNSPAHRHACLLDPAARAQVRSGACAVSSNPRPRWQSPSRVSVRQVCGQESSQRER